MEQLSPPSLKIQKHRWLHKNLANSWVLQKGMMDWFWELRQKSKWNFEIPPSFQFVESSLELHIARITHWKIAILAVLLMPGVTVNSRHECLSKGRTEGWVWSLRDSREPCHKTRAEIQEMKRQPCGSILAVFGHTLSSSKMSYNTNSDFQVQLQWSQQCQP